jgi:hypothetical protein
MNRDRDLLSVSLDAEFHAGTGIRHQEEAKFVEGVPGRRLRIRRLYRSQRLANCRIFFGL